MSVTFYDRQDERNEFNGRLLQTDDDLKLVFNEVRGRPPFLSELVTVREYKLMLGIGGDHGYRCAQHSTADDEPPYRVAVAAVPAMEDAEFLIGNTPTPVDGRNCLTAETASSIQLH